MPSGKTHFTTGIIASGAALYYMGGPLAYTLIGGLAALAPDIDHKDSTLGHLTPFHRFFKHRGFTHSYVAVMILFYGLTLSTDNHWLILSIINGYLSHIWLDYLIGTKGVQLWWPKKKRSSLRKRGAKR